MISNLQQLLFWWGKGRLRRFIGGQFEWRRTADNKVIIGEIIEIKASPSDTWRIIIAGTMHPVQRLVPNEYDQMYFDRTGCLRFAGRFWHRNRTPHIASTVEITLYPRRKVTGRKK
jgi:hypothetical protein